MASWPYVFASQPAGNVPASYLDSNFNAAMFSAGTSQNGYVPVWSGTAGNLLAGGWAIGTSANNLVQLNGSAQLPAVDGSLLTGIGAALVPRNYIAGYTLSNDAGSPNTVLDIAAGSAADSTNTQNINLGSAYTKSTAGLWAAGTGANGMGVGLTIANSTWYHVFAIINAGNPDVYFDTSVTAANKPVGTTYFRRIGSFLTDGSAHIISFTQNGSYFAWGTAVLDVNDTNPGTSAVLKTLASVPTGVNVFARLNIKPTFASTGSAVLFVSDPATSDQAPSNTAAPLGTNGATSAPAGAVPGGYQEVLTSTSAQIRYRLSASGASDVVRMATLGWIDSRGANN